MMPDLQERLVREQNRRDAALQRLEATLETGANNIANSVSATVQDVREGGLVRGAIRTSPFAACFASLGAGVLASRLFTHSASPASDDAQRVVVEIQSANGTVMPAAAPTPAPFNPLEMLLQALTVYGAVQRSIHESTLNRPEDTAPQNQPSDNPI